ncbi:non-hydrolyzing UDP-N-acetylglucosamine 2-epimerase [Streptomyces violascens]|uniref:non-hydrolyzing UDP-N-acetylglucosamine 2-epimerase n=1 Tax=Streptomyces violascens TaxID=67381 RepID=UPI0036C5E2AF
MTRPEGDSGGIAVVLGTRPELIKLAPVVKALHGRVRLFHTGQHYDRRMSGTFLADLGLPRPEKTFAVGGMPRTAQIAAAAMELDMLFARDRPDAVVVQGDTNAALAGALAANGSEVSLYHVEAGLRSYDRRMPEEHNRVLIDHLADVLCAATPGNAENLLAQGISPQRIQVTGNTIVEAARSMLPAAPDRTALLQAFGVSPLGYVLATVHRPENTDDPGILSGILAELGKIASASGKGVLLPLHPRTAAAARSAGLEPLLAPLRTVEPVGYRTFLALLADAALAVSDSGGVQEEVTVLKKPLIVVRCSTERPESMPDFARLVPPGPEISRLAADWLAEGPALHQRLAALPCPYGDEHVGERIAALAEHRRPNCPPLLRSAADPYL